MTRKRNISAGLLSLTIVLSLILTACGSGVPSDGATSADSMVTGAMTTQPMGEQIKNYLSAVDESYAFSVAETLSADESLQSNTMGFRTAGSVAEHDAADYLADEMKSIGLTDVSKESVKVDKWEFEDASLIIEGTDIDIMPVSYMVSGTGKKDITAEIVDAGTGFATDYESFDAEGKIVLVGVDQFHQAWIDRYIYEAALHGAVALVTYDLDGYGTYSDDVINLQDVRCEDVLPTVAISRNQYQRLSEAIDAGNTTATLSVQSVMEQNRGTSFNVMGKLKGKSSEQQIVVAGHYDMFFYGFQDNSSSVGLILGMAKAMVDSGYVPENDILFVAHGAGEWGSTGTEYDRARGAWEMIKTAHPEWAVKTLAVYYFNLSSIFGGSKSFQIGSVPELSGLVSGLVKDTNLLKADQIYENGIDPVSVDADADEPCVPYRDAGVPCFINVPGTAAGEMKASGESWIEQRYHTDSDTAETYTPEVMTSNLNVYGTMLIYLDQTPTLELDLTATCDDLEEAIDETQFKQAKADIKGYRAALKKLRAAAEGWNRKITEANRSYVKAVARDVPRKKLAALRKESAALNRKTLVAFKFIQDTFVGIQPNSDVVVRHVGYQENTALLSSIVNALKKGDLFNEKETGALDLAKSLNGSTEYGYYLFSPEAMDRSRAHVDASSDVRKFWAEEKCYVQAKTSQATISLLEKSGDADATFPTELRAYRAALESQRKQLAAVVKQETSDMETLAEMLR